MLLSLSISTSCRCAGNLQVRCFSKWLSEILFVCQVNRQLEPTCVRPWWCHSRTRTYSSLAAGQIVKCKSVSHLGNYTELTVSDTLTNPQTKPCWNMCVYPDFLEYMLPMCFCTCANKVLWVFPRTWATRFLSPITLMSYSHSVGIYWEHCLNLQHFSLCFSQIPEKGVDFELEVGKKRTHPSPDRSWHTGLSFSSPFSGNFVSLSLTTGCKAIGLQLCWIWGNI